MHKHFAAFFVLACGTISLLASIGLLLGANPGIVSAEPNQQTETFSNFACLDCHTNQNQLKELAVVEEEPEEPLSSGPG